MKQTINTFHQDKWKLTFSNIPSMDNVSDMNLYDLFVKDVTIPDYNVTEEYSYYMGQQIRHPLTKPNTDLSQIQISFKASENLKNYYNLYNYMQSVRYGQIDGPTIRLNTVKKINLQMLDNQNKEKSVFSFTECNLLTLSSLSLTMGTSEEIVFTTNFSYQESKLDFK